MRLMKNIGMMGFFMLMTTLLALSAVAADNPSHGRWWRQPNLVAKLNLSEQEKTKLDTLFETKRGRFIDLKATVDKEQLIMEDLMDKEPLDEPRIFGQLQRLEKARMQVAEERFRYMLEVRKIIGAERFIKLRQIGHEAHKQNRIEPEYK